MDREQTTIRIPVDLAEQLKKEACEKGMSFNGYLLWIIDKGRQCLPQ